MLSWIKNRIKNKLKHIFRSEFDQIRFDIYHDIEAIYYNFRWKEIANDESVEKVKVSLNQNLEIYLYKNTYLSFSIFSNNFEKEVLAFLKSNLSKSDCFIDIGANIGFFSLIASEIVAKDGQVLSFEPTCSTFDKLQENILLNKIGNISPYKVALSNYTGKTDFNVSVDGYDAFNSFMQPKHGNKYIVESVEVNTLDTFYDILQPFKNNIVIKIDTEGSEYQVINGSTKVLEELNPLIIMEFNDENTEGASFKCKDVYALLVSLGYRIFSLDNGQLIPKQNEPFFNYQNLIARKA